MAARTKATSISEVASQTNKLVPNYCIFKNLHSGVGCIKLNTRIICGWSNGVIDNSPW
jgi:hypothetical protein